MELEELHFAFLRVPFTFNLTVFPTVTDADLRFRLTDAADTGITIASDTRSAKIITETFFTYFFIFFFPLSQYHQNVVFLAFLSNRHLNSPDGFKFLKIFLISINTILYIATMLVEPRFPRMLSFFSCFTCNKTGTIL